MTIPTNFPIRPIKRPSDLNGIVNGQVPAHLLVDIGRRGSKMHHTAARGWRCLMAHLEPRLAELGVDDWDVSSIDPRSYQRQCEMFDGRKYPGSGRYLPQSMWAAHEAAGGWWGKRDNGTIQEYTWTAQDRTSPEVWRRIGGKAMAAKPGTSPHGDGLAVDLAVDDDDDSIADPITEAVVRFLMADDLALRCGFAWSTKSEPWHLQWYVGDDVPPLVLAWEQGQQPAPPTPPPTPTPVPRPPAGGLELIAMYQIALTYAPGTLVCRVTADEIIHEVSANAAAVDERAGVIRVTVGWEEFVEMCRSRRTVGNPFQGKWYDKTLADAWAAAQG